MVSSTIHNFSMLMLYFGKKIENAKYTFISSCTKPSRDSMLYKKQYYYYVVHASNLKTVKVASINRPSVSKKM